jgi:hypothetical protein
MSPLWLRLRCDAVETRSLPERISSLDACAPLGRLRRESTRDKCDGRRLSGRAPSGLLSAGAQVDSRSRPSADTHGWPGGSRSRRFTRNKLSDRHVRQNQTFRQKRHSSPNLPDLTEGAAFPLSEWPCMRHPSVESRGNLPGRIDVLPRTRGRQTPIIGPLGAELQPARHARKFASKWT